MLSKTVERTLTSIPGLESGALKVTRALHAAVLQGGEGVRSVVDVLHGTWFGHPLHPALTDLPIGAWSLAAFFDAAGLWSDSRDFERMADTLIAAGVVTAVPTALAGLADYSAISEDVAAPGAMHGMLNSAGLLLYLLALRDRRNGQRRRGIMLAALAYGAVGLAASLGGDLVYKHRVGVNNAPPLEEPKQWTSVLDSVDLHEREPRAAEFEGQPVLLYREGDTVSAISAVCNHAGGPLEDGKFAGHCVECPWHNSVFDLRDGSVRHGPATQPQPRYAARIRNGKVEIKVQQGET